MLHWYVVAVQCHQNIRFTFQKDAQFDNSGQLLFSTKTLDKVMSTFVSLLTWSKQDVKFIIYFVQKNKIKESDHFC